jgi:hypothetical protein
MNAKTALPAILEAFKPKLARLGIKDPDKVLVDVHVKFKNYKDVEWKIQDFVCPICESYSIFVTVMKDGENRKKTVNCETCKSKSSEREYNCVAIEKLVHFIHVDNRDK